uniref:Uncharacterized protein n=1 Tax=Pararge aegeria TaxID=116150 RepID=S4NLR0_9NEOP
MRISSVYVAIRSRESLIATGFERAPSSDTTVTQYRDRISQRRYYVLVVVSGPSFNDHCRLSQWRVQGLRPGYA